MKAGGSSSNGTLAGGSTALLPAAPTISAPMHQTNADEFRPQEFDPQEQDTNSRTTSMHGYDSNRRWINVGSSGSHPNYYSIRRDQVNGGYVGVPRNAGGRHIQTQYLGARPSFRLPPPPVAPPSPGPLPQFQSLGYPIASADMQSPFFNVSNRPHRGGVPFVPHPAIPAPRFHPNVDVQRARLLNQIDFYFSKENLRSDFYLRKNMDEEGWVPISLISGFNRVQRITDRFILDTVRSSTVVEVKGDKVRRRDNWTEFLLPPRSTIRQLGNVSSQPLSTLNSDDQAAQDRPTKSE